MSLLLLLYSLTQSCVDLIIIQKYVFIVSKNTLKPLNRPNVRVPTYFAQNQTVIESVRWSLIEYFEKSLSHKGVEANKEHKIELDRN